MVKRKVKLNQCECGKSYDLAEYGTTINLCYSCNEKRLLEFKKKDAIRKRDGRSKEVSSNIEKLADIEG